MLKRILDFEHGCRRDGRAGPLGYILAFILLAILLVISHSITGSWGF